MGQGNSLRSVRTDTVSRIVISSEYARRHRQIARLWYNQCEHVGFAVTWTVKFIFLKKWSYGLINWDERKKNSRLLSVLKQVGQKARCLITHLVCKSQNRPQNQTVSALLLVTFRVDGKGTWDRNVNIYNPFGFSLSYCDLSKSFISHFICWVCKWECFLDLRSGGRIE